MSSTINASQTTSFDCVVTGNPSPTIKWEQNGIEVLEAGTRIEIQETGSATSGLKSTLILMSTVASDAGAYACKASNSRGNESSQAANLTVQGGNCLSF